MKDKRKRVTIWYDTKYSGGDLTYQRKYPNEELIRFFGKYFFKIVSQKKRSNIKILELGCGSCGNLWMISREGFNAYGIDISKEAIKLGKKMLKQYGVTANLRNGDITSLPYADAMFDAVIDIFSIYCMPQKQFEQTLDEISRVMKHGGKFFSYHPSINSDAFKYYKPAKKIDAFTLEGIKRRNAPYFGNNYPFRFISSQKYKKILENKGFKVIYMEKVIRTYRFMKEKFELITIIGEKISK